jgi:O-antigen/teichoic acid export membrane protein
MVQVVGLVVTVALLPRLLGAEAYGRLAFALSLSYLGQILGDFGTLEVMGRFVPTLNQAQIGRLYTQTLIFKLAVGAICGLITAGAAMLLAGWMLPLWAGLIGVGVTVHVVGWTPYQLALGLNRVGIWMAEQAWRQWALLILLLMLFPCWGLTGALLAVLGMELIFCLIGLWWARTYWQMAVTRFDRPYLSPYLRFGLPFFGANLATVALYRSGPALVEWLTGDSRQTGYFNLALGLFLLAYITLGQFAQSLLPALSRFWEHGQTADARRWLWNFGQTGWWLGCLGAAMVWLLAGWLIPLVFGPEFTGAEPAFQWLSLGLPLAALVWMGSLAAVVTRQGQVKLIATLAALLIFTVLVWKLAPFYGAAGASLALSLAVVVNVILLGFFLRDVYAR